MVALPGADRAGAAETTGKKPPNIVFLMADDQTFYSLGCYGNPDVRTPNLDGLARDGMVFDNHYDTTAICMASRASVMTGLYEYRTGCNFDRGALLDQLWAQSYPKLLRGAGYQTAFAGKFGFEVTSDPEKPGVLPETDFDKWGGGPGQTSYQTAKNESMAHYAKEFRHSTLSYGAFGRDFIREAAGTGKPFCLSISFKAPHKPATPDPRFDEVYKGKAFTKPANYGREFGKHFSRQSRQGRQYERFESWGYADRYDEVMATYHQQVYGIDVAVGMIRQALEDSGVKDNTVVIYTSDNGYLCGSHGYGSKVLPYEESSRVPLIIFDPRSPNSGKQLRTRALTGNVDFAPTILALGGVKAPDGLDGKSLLPILDDPNAAVREALPLINVWGPQEVHSFGVMTRDWKYVFWNYGGGDFVPAEELYHLAADPLELRSLVNDANSVASLKKMRALYDRELAAWKQKSVNYHGYQDYGILFDRTLSWQEKQKLLKK